jgi:hypothetical protein
MIGPFQEADGAVSMRRILAVLFAIFSLACYAVGFKYSMVGWWAFIPGASFELGSLLLLFFTTWADIAEVIGKAKGE